MKVENSIMFGIFVQIMINMFVLLETHECVNLVKVERMNVESPLYSVRLYQKPF